MCYVILEGFGILCCGIPCILTSIFAYAFEYFTFPFNSKFDRTSTLTVLNYCLLYNTFFAPLSINCHYSKKPIFSFLRIIVSHETFVNRIILSIELSVYIWSQRSTCSLSALDIGMSGFLIRPVKWVYHVLYLKKMLLEIIIYFLKHLFFLNLKRLNEFGLFNWGIWHNFHLACQTIIDPISFLLRSLSQRERSRE